MSGPSKIIDEKRHNSRHEFTELVGLRYLDKLHEVRAVNISEKGISFNYDHPMDKGTPVVITFMGNSILVPGKVRHNSPSTTGKTIVGVGFDQTERELVDVLLDFNFSASFINGNSN